MAEYKLSLIAEVKKRGNGFTQAKEETDRLGNSFKGAGIKGKLMGAAAVAGGALIAQGLQVAAKAAIQFANESNAAFNDFDKGMREVFTLLPDLSAGARDQLTADALALGAELGRLPDEVVPALYQSISAGVPQENAIEFLRVASEAALGGVTDLETAVDGITSVTNAYGASALGAADATEAATIAADLMFTAVKGGKTNFEQLSQSLFNVIPTASALGVEFGNVTAALATMTAAGTPTSVATTQLRQLFVELSKEGTKTSNTFKEVAGVGFKEFIAQGNNMQDALQLLEQHAKDSGVGINDLFGSVEAGSAALSLTGQSTEKFTAELEAAEEAAGATATAAGVMAESVDHLANTSEATTAALKVQVGEALEPARRKWLELKIEVANATLELLNSVKALNDVKGQAQEVASELVLNAVATGDYSTASEKLITQLDESSSVLGRVSGGHRLVLDTTAEMIAATGDFSGTNEDLQASLTAVFGESAKVGRGYVSINGHTIGTIASLQQSSIAFQEQQSQMAINASTQELLNDVNRTSQEEFVETAASATVLTEETRAMINAQLEARYSMETATSAAADNAAANEASAAAISARQEALAAAAEAEAAAVQQSQKEFGQYAVAALDSGNATTNWTDELFRNAAAQGVTQEQLALLAAATGEYSDEQIEAMLKTAAMKAAVEQLSVSLANGEITTQEAIASLRDFEAQLDSPFEAELNFNDFEDAEAQASATRDAFLAAEGDYSATFTTTNTTVNETVEKGTSGAGGGASALHKGGRFRANELLMVGDGPGGKFVPGLTEFVVFDQPGTVISARDSARLFNSQGVPGGAGLIGDSEFASFGSGGGAVQINIPLTVIGEPSYQTIERFRSEARQIANAVIREKTTKSDIYARFP